MNIQTDKTSSASKDTDNENISACAILIILDGLGDRSYPELNHMTPLQAARTPCLDSLAALGSTGMYHASSPGIAMPSEEAHFSLFGYGPDEFPGRGALEALGAGIDLDEGDIAILARLVNVRDDNGLLLLEDDHPECSG